MYNVVRVQGMVGAGVSSMCCMTSETPAHGWMLQSTAVAIAAVKCTWVCSLYMVRAGPKRIPAINPNRAYLKSLAQGSAKKHFQSVEVDLREAHRRLIATSKDLQPVTYAAAARTHVYAC